MVFNHGGILDDCNMDNTQNLEAQHATLVKSLAKNGGTIREELTPMDCHQLHMAVGICGEAGELLDAVKKRAIYQKELDIENVIEELGDLEFYMQGLRESLGITRWACLQYNIAKLTKRYGQTYSNTAAQERLDKK